MLEQALSFFSKQVSERARSKFRLLSLPNTPVGTYYAVHEYDGGDPVVQRHSYDLAPSIFECKTLEGFTKLIAENIPYSGGNDAGGWFVCIGEDDIKAFLLTEPGVGLNNCERVELKLTETPAWCFVKQITKNDPKSLMRHIRATFTPGLVDTPDKLPDICNLITTLQNLSINITKNKKQNVSSSNDSIGLDVLQELNPGSRLPEMVVAWVSLYKELDYKAPVKLSCYFDFEDEKVCFIPVDADLNAAVSMTDEAIVFNISMSGIKRERIAQADVTNLCTAGKAVLS